MAAELEGVDAVLKRCLLKWGNEKNNNNGNGKQERETVPYQPT